MSDEDISRALDALEELLNHTVEHPDPVAVAAWHEAFKYALSRAEKGPQWPALQARGQQMTAKLNHQVLILQSLQAAVKREISAQTVGRRALSAYSPSAR